MRRIMNLAASPWLALLFRLYIGSVFIYASMSKIIYTGEFAENIAAYQILPWWLVNFTAAVLPWMEIICGVLLIIGVRVKSAALCIACRQLRRIDQGQTRRAPGFEPAFEIFRREAFGAKPGGRTLTASVASLTDRNRRQSIESRSESNKRPVINPECARQKPGIGGEILLRPHVQQERSARSSDDAGKFVERNGIRRRHVRSSVAGVEVERDLWLAPRGEFAGPHDSCSCR